MVFVICFIKYFVYILSFSPTDLINSIIHEHSYSIPIIQCMLGQRWHNVDPAFNSLECFSYVCSICACLVLSVSSSSSCPERLRLVIVVLPGLFSYLFYSLSYDPHY